MADANDLDGYVAQLKLAAVIPLPSSDTPEHQTAYRQRLEAEGVIVEISEEKFQQLLEGQDSRFTIWWRSGSHFAFAQEGFPLSLAWQGEHGRCYLRDLNNDETFLFSSLAGIEPPLP
jgi:hypothetical protein